MAFRLIQSDVPVSTSLNQLSHWGERLYWRLLSQTDQWGRLPGEHVKIRDLCIPRLAVSDTELAEALDELVRAGRIVLYCVDGVWACQLVDFDRHQAFSRKRRAPSRYPDPPGTDTSDTLVADTKPLHRAMHLDRETETAEEVLSPTAVLQCVELPDFESGRTAVVAKRDAPCFHQWDLGEVCRGLRGADDRSPFALGSVLKGMPEGTLPRALEQLERRRRKQPRLDSEVKYLVSTCAQMRDELGFASVGSSR